jgi:putative heme-binding domain-containing protein
MLDMPIDCSPIPSRGDGIVGRVRAALTTLVVLTSTPSFAADTPQWIWSTNSDAEPQTVWFRKVFPTPPYMWNARLTLSADDEAEVFLNGKPVAVCTDWNQPVRAEVSMRLHHGTNVLGVRARNREGPGGLLVHLNMGGAESQQVISDTNWVFSTRDVEDWTSLDFDDDAWSQATLLGPHGIAPWGDILSRASATPADSIRVLPGFHVELLRSALPGEGSWVCMAFDERGRLIVSPEGDKPLIRVTLNSKAGIERVEEIMAPIRFAMGLLAAHGSLYANARGPEGTGLYCLKDANDNDQFETSEVRFLREFKGFGEHGYHALALGPDDRIYVLNGNGTRLPDGISSHSPYRNYAEDVLSLNPDETTRAGGARAPGCVILRTDPEGREWELFAGGMRNAYDFDFNPDGELFTFDSDNEWDWGTPWYRPTRVYHCVSGAEMGWRDGTRAWPDYYPDMVSGVVDVGIGSPCGVEFGTHARFPERYRRALFIQDWSYGRILAVHLEPEGAGYRATHEEFVRGQPLNLTSLAFGPDGAMYFITGGRGTQSGLYRVSYRGELPSEAGPLKARAAELATAGLRAQRRQLEALHGRNVPRAVDAIWEHLGSTDPAIRFAARVALESQDLTQWQDRALQETNSTTALTALLAMARVGGPTLQPDLLRALGRFPLATLEMTHRLAKYRVVQLSFLRQGRPGEGLLELAREKLNPRYPAATWFENRELSRLLVYLEAQGVVPRTLDLIAQALTAEQQIHYITQLRNLRADWSEADRRRYFEWWLQPRDHLAKPGSLLHWFHDVGREYVDGASLNRHLEAFRRDATAALPENERERLKPLFEQPIFGAQLMPSEPREFVHAWTMNDVLTALDHATTGRDFERGRRAFIDTQCYTCHRLGNAGGGIGPELTAVGSKYTRRELLESLLEPSKVISEQFQNVDVFLKDGDAVTGRLVRESDSEVVIETDPLARSERTVARAEVDEVRASKLSPMPEGLLNILTREEILDLLAFLESNGNPSAPAFRVPAPRASAEPQSRERE